MIATIIEEAKNILENKSLDFASINTMLSRQALLPYAQWKQDKPYTRVCLYEDEQFELILICWNPLAKTAVHNHNNQNCWVFFFDTDFQEVVYDDKGKQVLQINHVSKGTISHMKDNSKCHSLQNIANTPVMSLHLYNMPIKSCDVMKENGTQSYLEHTILEYDVKL